ncbi:MAG: hypothetical protein AAF546_01850 [Verrucomicrobiota bacterium]
MDKTLRSSGWRQQLSHPDVFEIEDSLRVVRLVSNGSFFWVETLSFVVFVSLWIIRLCVVDNQLIIDVNQRIFSGDLDIHLETSTFINN